MAYLFIPPYHLFLWLTGKQGFYNRETCKLLLIAHTQLIRIDLRIEENKKPLLLPSQCGDVEDFFPFFHLQEEALQNETWKKNYFLYIYSFCQSVISTSKLQICSVHLKKHFT